MVTAHAQSKDMNCYGPRNTGRTFFKKKKMGVVKIVLNNTEFKWL
jgi:hypothetical protein